ncbi:ATP-binding protein [Sphingobium bisphenolivorans]|uniref:ATP-binding protein n=1 Tax=Sphingobium bisphenolivorans TaxID=1335760 RepID=UPI0003AA08B2|nr:ATP-binding protein [Sphingobium bisphenolivorans]
MQRFATTCVIGLLAVSGIAWLTSAYLPVLGFASAALLYLLPVLYAATRGGVGPGLIVALVGAGSYNFFLLPPRYTFRIHGIDNLVSVFVLVAVALVTSRLATRLMAREAEALERARCSGELAELSAILASHPSAAPLQAGIDWVAARHGDLRLLAEGALPERDAAFSPLDLSALAWAFHNGDATGHGTAVMPAADWTFMPLAPKNPKEGHVAAIARPFDGRLREQAEIEHLRQLCILLGQSGDRHALETERRERERLEEADRLRRAFLASLAHDFRTPLTVITGRLAILAQNHPDARDALGAAQRLDRMMTDLIGAARIEAGSLAPAMESVDLVDAVSSAVNALMVPQWIAVERDIPADLPFVTGDPLLLHHVITNLLDNALKHARSCVTLLARATEDVVLFSVVDDGPGIPFDDRTRVFERFIRLEGGDREDGSGLGLAIVKGFTDAMGMTVSVNSTLDGGTSLAVTMPLAGREAM